MTPDSYVLAMILLAKNLGYTTLVDSKRSYTLSKTTLPILNTAWTMKKNYLVTSSKGKQEGITQLGC